MNFRVFYDDESVDEGAKILYNYNKKINKKNFKKIRASHRNKDVYLIVLILLVIISSISLFCFIRYEEPDTFTISYNVGLYLFIWIILLIKLYNRNKGIKKIKREIMQPTSIELNEQEIRINRERDPYFMLWVDIKEIAINPHCILLMPKRPYEKAIIIPNDYKAEIIKKCQSLEITGLIHDYTIK